MVIIGNISTWNRDTAPEIKTKTRRFKEDPRPDGQYSPSTATSSWVTLKQSLKIQVYNSCVIPVMTHGAETWSLISQANKKLATANKSHTGTKNHGRGHRRNWTSQKTAVDMGRARQQNTRYASDISYHHMETIRREAI